MALPYTQTSQHQLKLHFEEPWMYTSGPYKNMYLSRSMWPYYNHPFPTHPDRPLPEGQHVFLHRVARHNVPHDALTGADRDLFVMPPRHENEWRTARIKKDGSLQYTGSY